MRCSSVEQSRPWLNTSVAFFLLLAARGVSAGRNLIHDCDEVFNYWEPLHYLLYGFGLQTWEYSAQFALRSWLYILMHAVVAAPLAWFYGAAAEKQAVFIQTRAALGLMSAATEAYLFSVVQKHSGQRVATIMLCLLCLSSGMFAASTAFLPSSFAMYAMTAATAALINGQNSAVIVSAATGVLWGWVVAAVAFVPHALAVLFATPLHLSLRLAVGSVVLLGSSLAVADKCFYGRWTVSLWNFVRYNVVGGGQSSLYGVEGPLYYLHNGALAFNAALPLALAYPLLAALGPGATTVGSTTARRRLLVAAAALWLWLAAISYLPHKEERFLYVVYPLICLTAAASVDALAGIVTAVAQRIAPRQLAQAVGTSIRVVLPLLIGLLCLSRTAALLRNYPAPMQLYSRLPSIPSERTGLVHVCVGDEWYRFPSSFFLPDPRYRLQFVKSGFDGHLPRAFNTSEGGTRAAPRQLNDQNREEPENYWSGMQRCDYAVGQITPPNSREHGWHIIASAPMLDKNRSPGLTRAFFVPELSQRRNKFVTHSVWEKRPS